MSLLTRCPRCTTLFRVLPAQLQARAGQVRCGRCMHVFDGFSALAGEQPNAASDPVHSAPEAASKTPAAPAAPKAAGQAPPAAPAGATAAAPVAPARSTTGSSTGVTAPAKAPLERVRDFADERIATPLKDKLLRKPSARAKQISICALLALLLGAQLAYAFRSQLAARYPAARSALESVCDVAGCSVLLPQRPDLVKIEASDVHMIDAAKPALIQLTATLRSYASYDLAYPALDLVLTNASEHALARRIFVPEEYLDQTRDPAAGFPPRAEITVALDLDTGDLNASGFRLDLIAAPAPQAAR